MTILQESKGEHMVKEISKKETEYARYEDYVDYFKRFNNMFVVLKKPLHIKYSDKYAVTEYDIEKGSLVKMSVITAINGKSQFRISIECYDDIKIGNTNTFQVYSSKILDKLPQKELSEQAKKCFDFVKETFGITGEIEKIGKKLNLYGKTAKTLTMLSVVISTMFAITGFVILLASCIAPIPKTAKIICAILLIIGLVAGSFFVFYDIDGDSEIYTKITRNAMLKKWKYYDNIINQYAEYYSTANKTSAPIETKMILTGK
jgi:hypothetical protein